MRKGLLVITVAAAINGCAVSTTTTEFSKKLPYPKQTKTTTTDYLSCFGDMLTEYRYAAGNGTIDPLRIAIVSVNDSTNVSTVQYPNSEIPNDFTNMTLSIASKIGGPIRLVHIPKDNEIISAYQYGATPGKKDPFFNTYGASHYRQDTIQIYGALTEYDRFIRNARRSRDASVEVGGGSGETELEFSRFDDKNTARMTMDFYTAHGFVGDIVNHSSSTNTVKLFQRGHDRSYGISVDGNSLGYAVSHSIVDARHKAIRLLIEWGMIETLGKYEYIPYWKCLPNSKNQAVATFKDLIGNDSVINFSSLQQPDKESEETEEDSTLIDKRDKDLMLSVKSSYDFAEYVDDKIREHVPRPLEPSSTEITDSRSGKIFKVQFTSKKELLSGLLKLYQKNSAEYNAMGLDVVLDMLHQDFITNGVLSQQDDKFSSDMYLALWLNAPVRRNARWAY
ncbi:hypothetical protein DZA50_05555 [Kangiella sp. HD9-110m-PIT-SAG07]|nr:hypothetical protein DZA50_05555 [Kangiella sp. HD9-110m-PIT-SAG07]